VLEDAAPREIQRSAQWAPLAQANGRTALPLEPDWGRPASGERRAAQARSRAPQAGGQGVVSSGTTTAETRACGRPSPCAALARQQPGRNPM
jgi:hypothetical protein